MKSVNEKEANLMRLLTAILLMIVMGVSVVWAQTPEPPPGENSSVIVTLLTGNNGTTGNLTLALSGTFSGDPYVVTLGQPGDLQPGTTNTFSFIVPHTFCQMFQWRLMLNGSDDWLGSQLSIQIDGAQVYYDGAFSDGGPLTANGWRSGTWDQTAMFQSHCSEIPIELIFNTGPDGTVDNPVFYVQGNFSASPYAYYMNQPNDLLPGNTDVYTFNVPMDFCEMFGWRIVKGTTNGVDNSWLPTQLTIYVGGLSVYFDSSFSDVGPITSASQIGGAWSGSQGYLGQCPNTDLPNMPIFMTLPPNGQPNGQSSQVVNPNSPQSQPAPTLIMINPNLQLFTTPTSMLPNPPQPIPQQLKPSPTPTFILMNPQVNPPQPTLIHINPQFIPIQPSPTLIYINPQILHPVATATPNMALVNPHVIVGLQTASAPAPPPNPGPGLTQCAGAPVPRLHAGGQARVLPGVTIRIRATPGTSATIYAQMPPGTVFSVLAGPNCGDNYTWWQVNYNGIVGWIAEGTGADYYVEPA